MKVEHIIILKTNMNERKTHIQLTTLSSAKVELPAHRARLRAALLAHHPSAQPLVRRFSLRAFINGGLARQGESTDPMNKPLRHLTRLGGVLSLSLIAGATLAAAPAVIEHLTAAPTPTATPFVHSELNAQT